MSKIIGKHIVERDNPNIIYNPEGFLFQRLLVGGAGLGTPTNIVNDAFGPDRWNILCSANHVAVSRATDANPGSNIYAIRLDKATSGGYFGMMQMLETAETIPFQNQTIRFGLSCRTESSEVSQVRIAVLGWSGSSDSITSSIVSSWGAVPTYIANVTEYASATLNLTNSYQEVSLSAAIPSSCNNLIFFIHTTNSESVGDSILCTAIRANMGNLLLPYARRENANELSLCQRYYEYTGSIRSLNTSGSTQGMRATWVYKTEKRITPTIAVGTGLSESTSPYCTTCFGNVATGVVYDTAFVTADAEL
jgi:hypothetical protein